LWNQSLSERNLRDTEGKRIVAKATREAVLDKNTVSVYNQDLRYL